MHKISIYACFIHVLYSRFVDKHHCPHHNQLRPNQVQQYVSKACGWLAKLLPLAPYPNALFSDAQSVIFMRETGRHTSDREHTHRVELAVASVEPGCHYCFIYVVCNGKGVPHAFSQSAAFHIPLPHFKKVFHVQSRTDTHAAVGADDDLTQSSGPDNPEGIVMATGLAPPSPSYCGASVGATVQMSRFAHPKTTCVMRQLRDDRPPNAQRGCVCGCVCVCAGAVCACAVHAFIRVYRCLCVSGCACVCAVLGSGCNAQHHITARYSTHWTVI